MLQFIQKYILEFVVFFSGAAVMIFEIVGSRVIAPYFGTSIIIWTSIIGVILGSLSLGYYFGGKIADKKASKEGLGFIFLISVIFLLLTYVVKDMVLMFLQNNVFDIKISAVLASIFLFSPVSIILGVVSPYAVRLKLHNIQTSGSEIGKLYAISTVGSIFGTFMSGFYLIPTFGTNNILFILILILFVLSLLLSPTKNISFKIVLLLLGTSMFLTLHNTTKANKELGKFDLDTSYNRVSITPMDLYGKSIKGMFLNNSLNSGISVDSDRLVFPYNEFYDLFTYFTPNFESTLMIGGAGYSYPKYYLNGYKDKKIDVVEIDEGLTKIAREHFGLEDNKNLTIYHEDGRTFFNKNTKKYDAILGDAFGGNYSIPYHLTTREFVEKVYNSLTDNGVVVLNTIGSLGGTRSDFLRAEYATYKEKFPQVFLFPVKNDFETSFQNIMLVATKSDKKFDFKSEDPKIQALLDRLWTKEIIIDLPILTDDYAPVDYYVTQGL